MVSYEVEQLPIDMSNPTLDQFYMALQIYNPLLDLVQFLREAEGEGHMDISDYLAEGAWTYGMPAFLVPQIVSLGRRLTEKETTYLTMRQIAYAKNRR